MPSDAEIIASYKNTLSSCKTARQFGVSSTLVLKILRNNNVAATGLQRYRSNAQNYSCEIQEQIKKQYESGISLEKLAEQFGGSYSSVRNAVVRTGGKLRQNTSIYYDQRIEAFGEIKTFREWAKDPRCKVCLRKLVTRVFGLRGKQYDVELAMQFEGNLKCRKSKCHLTNEEITERCQTFLNGKFTVINRFADFAYVNGIYGIFNTITGKLYVGSAGGKNEKGMGARLDRHQNQLEKGIHCNHGKCQLQRSWNKYGEAAFAFILLEDLTGQLTDILKRETYWMDHYKTRDNTFGYNICHPIKTRQGVFTSPFSLPIVKEWIRNYINDFDKPPVTNSGIIPYDDLKRTWNALHQALVIGNGGLPGGMSLRQVICDVIGKPYAKKTLPRGISYSYSQKERQHKRYNVTIHHNGKRWKIGRFLDQQQAENALTTAKIMLNNDSAIEEIRQAVIIPKNSG